MTEGVTTVSHAKKPITTVMNAADSVGAATGSRWHKILKLLKEIWYIPFVWSLTWYLYWTIRDVVVFNRGLLEITPWNYVGIVASVTALLMNSSTVGKLRVTDRFVQDGIKPVVAQVTHTEVSLDAATQLESNSQKAAFDEPQIKRGILSENSGELKRKNRRQLQPKEPQQIAEINQAEQEPQECLKATDDPSICFVCPKLIECLHRRN